MAGRNPCWVILTLLLALATPAVHAQAPPFPSTPVQVQSAPPDPPPVPPVPPASPYLSNQLPSPQPPPIPAPTQPLPPVVGIDVGPAPLIPAGPLFLTGQPPPPLRLIDGAPFFGIQLDAVLPSVNENLQTRFGQQWLDRFRGPTGAIRCPGRSRPW